MPIVRRRRHLQITLDTFKIFHTRPELRNLPWHFWNPSATKPCNLFRRIKPADMSTETLRKLEDISKVCYTCKRDHKGLLCFHVTLSSGNFIFNHELALDLVQLKGNTELRAVDTKKFTPAIFIPDKYTANIWNMFTVRWTESTLVTQKKSRSNQRVYSKGNNLMRYVNLQEQRCKYNVSIRPTQLEMENVIIQL